MAKHESASVCGGHKLDAILKDLQSPRLFFVLDLLAEEEVVLKCTLTTDVVADGVFFERHSVEIVLHLAVMRNELV